jgi:pimeloyl-ACP methyl ester carboxylesterase
MKRPVAALLLFFGLAGCSAAETGRPDSLPVSGEARSADGVTIRYEVHGSGDTALVLVPGWTNSRGIWGEHPRTLSTRYRVVALDLAGHGDSGAERTEWTMGAFGEDVVAVVEQLDLEPIVLVGFSMGAAVVVEAAERMPERVLGVVFVDALHDPDQPPPAGTADQMEGMFRAAWGDTAFLRGFAFTPDAPDSLIRYVGAMSPPVPLEHWFPALRSFLAWQATDFTAALERLRVPVAAINTTSQATNTAALRRHAPSFTLDTLAGVGHAGILLQRVEDFDARLLAIVERFATASR